MTPPLSKILLVEDDIDIQTIASLGLKAVGGFNVEICSSGKEAVETAPQFTPDLILLDVMMPGMDGIATLEALRSIPKIQDTPVIFLTAKVQTHEVAYYKQLGVLDVIAKPFDPMTLPATVKQMWLNYYE
ncbi:MAG: response regulator [Oscillatoria sp. PMC 1068.18]|nr:response regulator [Oscillatoria sp. PMC 1076.18]MEC4990309.1 response regulator [Oscillatoria sp. PMC 1068.18]